MTKLLQSNNEMTSAAVGFSWNIIFLGNFGFKIRLSKAFGFLGQKTYREKNIVCVRSSDIEFDDNLKSDVIFGAASGALIGTVMGSATSGAVGGALGGYLTGRKQFPKLIYCRVEFDDGVIIKLKVTGEDNIKKMIELSHSRGI